MIGSVLVRRRRRKVFQVSSLLLDGLALFQVLDFNLGFAHVCRRVIQVVYKRTREDDESTRLATGIIYPRGLCVISQLDPAGQSSTFAGRSTFSFGCRLRSIRLISEISWPSFGFYALADRALLKTR